MELMSPVCDQCRFARPRLPKNHQGYVDRILPADLPGELVDLLDVHQAPDVDPLSGLGEGQVGFVLTL